MRVVIGSPRSRLGALVEQGNSVVVIEYNLDVMKTADWITDLRQEGGEIVAEGVPEVVAKAEGSFTGRYLAPVLGN